MNTIHRIAWFPLKTPTQVQPLLSSAQIQCFLTQQLTTFHSWSSGTASSIQQHTFSPAFSVSYQQWQPAESLSSSPKLSPCPSWSASNYLLKIIFVCLPFQKYFHFLFITLFLGIIAKDCFFTLVKSRLLLGSPSWSVGCFHAENDLIHRKMVVNCPIMITSKVKPFSRQNYTGKGE